MWDILVGRLFARDKSRAERFSLKAGNLLLDYSKNHVNATTRKLFAQLAHTLVLRLAALCQPAMEGLHFLQCRLHRHALADPDRAGHGALHGGRTGEADC